MAHLHHPADPELIEKRKQHLLKARPGERVTLVVSKGGMVNQFTRNLIFDEIKFGPDGEFYRLISVPFSGNVNPRAWVSATDFEWLPEDINLAKARTSFGFD